MKKIILLAFVCLLGNTNINAQTDTLFWFVAPEATSAHGDNPVLLRITALDQAATVTITQPANPSFNGTSVMVQPNSSISVDLTNRKELLENKPSNQILNKGLLIRSTQPITAYYEIVGGNLNPEIFALKGRNALGTNFMIPAQNILNNAGYNPSANSSFDIVATENNTTVTITPSKNITGHAAGVPFTITLNRGETYSAMVTGLAAADHLMGSTVTSNKPVAITIKDDSITGFYGGCQDLAGDQIIPIQLLGTKHIVMPGYLSQPDRVFILATQDNTTISVNGSNVGSINAKQTHTYIVNGVSFIETNKPVYILHLSGFGCEVGHAIVPQIECTGSKVVGITRGGDASEAFYMNLLVKNGGQGNFTFNGNTSVIGAAQFQDVPNTGGQWKYARIQLTTAQLAVGNAAIVKNSSADFHLGIINGGSASGCRYGYFSDFSRLSGATLTSNSPVCEGNNLSLDVNFAQQSNDNFTYSWTGPNGFSSTAKNPVINNATLAAAGTYSCTITKAGCSSEAININIVINPGPQATATANKTLFCAGETLQLSGTSSISGVSYNWSGPNGFSSNQQNPQLTNLAVAHGGDYTLSVASTGCTSQRTINISVNKVPDFTINAQSVYCEANTITITQQVTQQGSGASFVWSGPNGFSSTNTDAVIPNAAFANAGTYTLTYSAPACTDKSQSKTITVQQSPIANASSNAPFCEGGNLQLNAAATLSGTAYSWSGPNGFNSNSANPLVNNANSSNSGNYILTTLLNGCSTKDTVNVVVNAIPSSAINGVSPACRFSTVDLTNSNSITGTSYVWSGPNGFSATTQNVQIPNFSTSNVGNYTLTATSNGCSSTSSFMQDVKESPVVFLNNLRNVCADNVGYYVTNYGESSGISGSGSLSGAGINSDYFDPSVAGVGAHRIIYTYNATNGCSGTVEKDVIVYPLPQISAGLDKTILEGGSIKLEGSVTASNPKIVWSPAATLSNSTTATPTARPKITTKYELKVTSLQGCISIDSVLVKVLKEIKIPNAFSPNGDGINEQWDVTNLSEFKESDIEIFNRYGMMLWKSKGYGKAWDGKYNGKMVPTGTYYYIIKLNDGFRHEPFAGWVQVIY